MDVSIVITTYNEERDIGNCLNSVLSRSYCGRYEVIVVDDNSKDRTQEIVREYEKKYSNVKLIVPEFHHAWAEACNLGFELSKGDYCVFLNADTVVDTKWLESLVDSAKKTGGVCYSAQILPRTNGVPVCFRLNKFLFARKMEIPKKHSFPIEVNVLSGTSVIISRDIINEIGKPFDTSVTIGLGDRFKGSDLELGLKLNKLGIKIYCDPNSVIFHNQKSEYELKKSIWFIGMRFVAHWKHSSKIEFLKKVPFLILGSILSFLAYVKNS